MGLGAFANAQKGRGKAQSAQLSLDPDALAAFRAAAERSYDDTEEDALAAEMGLTTALLEAFNEHSAAWEAMEARTRSLPSPPAVLRPFASCLWRCLVLFTLCLWPRAWCMHGHR